MSKATAAILYIAIILTVWVPVVEMIDATIMPGIQTLTTALQEISR